MPFFKHISDYSYIFVDYSLETQIQIIIFFYFHNKSKQSLLFRNELYAVAVYKRRLFHDLNNENSKSRMCFDIDTKLTKPSVGLYHIHYIE